MYVELIIGAALFALIYLIIAMRKREYRRTMILGLIIIDVVVTIILNVLVNVGILENAVLFPIFLILVFPYLILVPSDAKSKGMSAPLWALIVAFTGIFGAAAYYFVSRNK